MNDKEKKELLDMFKLISSHMEVKDINGNNIDALFIKDEYMFLVTPHQKELILKFKSIPLEDYFEVNKK